jgi:hypothetical protein
LRQSLVCCAALLLLHMLSTLRMKVQTQERVTQHVVGLAEC